MKRKEKNENKISFVNIEFEHVKKLYIFDFDATLFDTPKPTYANKLYYFRKTGRWYTDHSWWGNEKSLTAPLSNLISLDRYVFDDFRKRVKEKKKEKKKVIVVVMTGRHFALKDCLLAILKRYEVTPDMLIMKPNNYPKSSYEYKLEELERFVKNLKKLEKIEMWDDNWPDIRRFERLKGRKEFKNVRLVVHDVVADRRRRKANARKRKLEIDSNTRFSTRKKRRV